MRTRSIGMILALLAVGCALPRASRAVEGAPTLAGQWVLIPGLDQDPAPRGGRAMGPGGGGRGDGAGGGDRGGEVGVRGGWGGRRGGAGGGRAGSGARGGMMGRLPAKLNILEQDGRAMLQDSTGATLEQIVTATSDSTPPPAAPGVRRMRGHYDHGRLTVEHPSPMGGVITETYAVREKEDYLEIRVKVTADDHRATREFLRVYRPAGTN